MAVYNSQRTKAPVEKGKKQDQIALSADAKLLAELKNELQKIPDIRHEKVQSLKQAIDKDEYQIDSREVAAKLLQEAAFNKILLPEDKEG